MTGEGNGFTPTQRRLLDVLSDGEVHDRDELVKCIGDELAVWKNVPPHLTAIRKKLRLNRQDIICQVVNRRFKYRLVGLVNARVK